MEFQLIKDGLSSYIGGTGEPHENIFGGNDPIFSMCREMIQNSLDARHMEDKPVKVAIKKIDINPQNIPGINEYIDVLKKGLAGKDKDEFKKRIAILEGESLQCLVISDYNTVGLAGALEKFNLNKTTPFMALTRGVGDSVKKSGSSGGSFGYGKGAASLNSILKLVFYQTINVAGERASTGVASYPTISLNEDSTSTRAFFESSEVGVAEKGLLDFHENLSKRSEEGTDVIITGFIPTNKKWEKKAIKAVLDSFFYAIYTNKLIVDVEGTVIDSKILEELVNQYCKNQRTHCYLNSLKSGDITEATVEVSGKKLGEIRLFLSHSKENTLGAAWIRETGMTIDNFQENLSWKTYNGQISGVLYFQGEELNKVLKSAEDPTHTKREKNRVVLKGIKNYDECYNQIVKFVQESLKSFKGVSGTDSFVISGLGSFLSQDIDGEDKGNNRELLSDNVTSINEKKFRYRTTNESIVKVRKKRQTNRKSESKTKSKNKVSGSKVNSSSDRRDSSVFSSKVIVQDVKNGKYLLKITNTGDKTKATISLKLANETADLKNALPLSIIEVIAQSGGNAKWVSGTNEFVTILPSNSKTKFELHLDYDELCNIYVEVKS